MTYINTTTVIVGVILVWGGVLVMLAFYVQCMLKKQARDIECELAKCREAFKLAPNAKAAWCVHHTVWAEYLTEPYENRIQYILSMKPKHEQAVRFRNFRPSSGLSVWRRLELITKRK